jgi:hypothetical protein
MENMNYCCIQVVDMKIFVILFFSIFLNTFKLLIKKKKRREEIDSTTKSKISTPNFVNLYISASLC